MKPIKLLCLSALFLLPLGAEVLTKGERDRAMSHMHATRKSFLDATSGLSQAQWNFKAAPGRWSIAECAEHLTESENFLRGMLQATVEKAAVDDAKRESRRAGLDSGDAGILAAVADRSQKAQAPEPLKPSGKWSTREALVDEFKQRRDATIRYLETTQDDLRGRTTTMVPGMEMDLYQVALMISAHTNRHIAQMQEVKADPAYPKK